MHAQKCSCTNPQKHATLAHEQDVFWRRSRITASWSSAPDQSTLCDLLTFHHWFKITMPVIVSVQDCIPVGFDPFPPCWLSGSVELLLLLHGSWSGSHVVSAACRNAGAPIVSAVPQAVAIGRKRKTWENVSSLPTPGYNNLFQDSRLDHTCTFHTGTDTWDGSHLSLVGVFMAQHMVDKVGFKDLF